jgi:hypothetical protein
LKPPTRFLIRKISFLFWNSCYVMLHFNFLSTSYRVQR